MKVAVIGAGASGVLAAIKASEKNDVTLFESNDKTLKKLLITGNGKCNYWNSDININNYNTDNKEILNQILMQKDNTFNYLTNIGIYPIIKGNLYYPYSQTSASVKELFDKSLNNVKIIYNEKVYNIEKENDKFIINNRYFFDKVIISTGSKACPKTGSDGSFYSILSKHNIKINPVLPALVQIKTKGNFLKDWDGLRIDGKVKLFINDIFVKEEIGEIQLTNYGISGICVFNISQNVSVAINNNENVKVKLDLFNEDFYSFMEKRNKELNKSISILVESIFNYKLSNILFKISKIDQSKKWNELTEQEKRNLSNLINNFELEIIGTNDFDRAQVCTGGVSLNEINPYTMQLNKAKDLYICGEILDVDGLCGGFNLSFAFISGFIAGELND